jgi:osmoprotectant transport system substrate-binding protein
MRSRLRLLGVLLTGLLLSACGLETNYSVPYEVQPGSIKAEPSLRGATFVVGSKDFTENILLGYMAQYALSAAGANVQDLTNIQGSNSSRQALQSGDIDVNWDYTGTGWLSYLGHDKPIANEEKQYQATAKEDLARNNLAWLRYSPLNNTYAFAVQKKFAQQHHLKSLSDMVKLLKKDPSLGTFCLETEFVSRPDGMPGVRKAYGFQGSIKTLGTGAIYESIGGLCNFGEVFTTDGRIIAKNLAVLQDDKKFFPQYNAAAVVREDTLKRYPKVREVLEPIAAHLTNEKMQRLGAEVDVTGKDAAEVARDWMVSEGLVKYNAGS